MRVGTCCAIEDVPEVLDSGFDYAEIPAFQLATLENLDGLKSAGIETSNLFFPGGVSLYGEERAAAIAVGVQTIRLAAEIGMEVMVIGSGGARRAPEGVSPLDAQDSFVDLVAELAVEASRVGITLAPESLNRRETNVGNDLIRLSGALHARGIGYTMDTYHVLVEAHEEAIEADWAAQLQHGLPDHLHVANYERTVPEATNASLTSLFRMLRQKGYAGRLSFEGNRGDHSWAQVASRLRALSAG